MVAEKDQTAAACGHGRPHFSQEACRLTWPGRGLMQPHAGGHGMTLLSHCKGHRKVSVFSNGFCNSVQCGSSTNIMISCRICESIRKSVLW